MQRRENGEAIWLANQVMHICMLIMLQEGGEEWKAPPKLQTERGRGRKDTADTRESTRMKRLNKRTNKRRNQRELCTRWVINSPSGFIPRIWFLWKQIDLRGEGGKEENHGTNVGTWAGLGGIRKLKLLIDLKMLGVVKQRAFWGCN